MRLALLRTHALLQYIAIQIRFKALQCQCGVELSPAFSSVAQFDSRHLSNQSGNVVTRNRPRLEALRIGAEPAHKGSPVKG